MLPTAARAYLGKMIAVCALGCILTGCGKSKVTQENFNKIDKGMTIEQVEAILGEGTNTSGDGSLVAAQVGVDVGAKQSSFADYVWESGKHKITVTFKQGKVVGKQSTE
jgi:hypothetical protein